jgi:hypothetical protein
MMKLPQARNSDIVMQQAGKELLIYNLITHKAYHLNETSKTVFNACDGKTSFENMKHLYKFSDGIIYLALDELKANDLIEDYESNYFAGLSRREALRKVGLSSAAILPVVLGLISPTAAEAQSACANPSGASAGTVVATTSIGSLNVNVIAAILAGMCCSNSYTNINFSCNITSFCVSTATCI